MSVGEAVGRLCTPANSLMHMQEQLHGRQLTIQSRGAKHRSHEAKRTGSKTFGFDRSRQSESDWECLNGCSSRSTGRRGRLPPTSSICAEWCRSMGESAEGASVSAGLRVAAHHHVPMTERCGG